MKAQINQRTPRLGDIFLMRFTGSGSEQSGLRPGLVFQNNTGNRFSPNIIALPLTTSLKKQGQPTHVILNSSDTGLKRTSMVLCENPERMSKDKIGAYITTLPDHYMKQVAVASLLSSAAISYLDLEHLTAAWKQASALNACISV